MKAYKGSPALDAGLLAAAQAVEHYEISRYGALIAWAEDFDWMNSPIFCARPSKKKRRQMKL